MKINPEEIVKELEVCQTNILRNIEHHNSVIPSLELLNRLATLRMQYYNFVKERI